MIEPISLDDIENHLDMIFYNSDRGFDFGRVKPRRSRNVQAVCRAIEHGGLGGFGVMIHQMQRRRDRAAFLNLARRDSELISVGKTIAEIEHRLEGEYQLYKPVWSKILRRLKLIVESVSLCSA